MGIRRWKPPAETQTQTFPTISCSSWRNGEQPTRGGGRVVQRGRVAGLHPRGSRNMGSLGWNSSDDGSRKCGQGSQADGPKHCSRPLKLSGPLSTHFQTLGLPCSKGTCPGHLPACRSPWALRQRGRRSSDRTGMLVLTSILCQAGSAPHLQMRRLSPGVEAALPRQSAWAIPTSICPPTSLRGQGEGRLHSNGGQNPSSWALETVVIKNKDGKNEPSLLPPAGGPKGT